MRVQLLLAALVLPILLTACGSQGSSLPVTSAAPAALPAIRAALLPPIPAGDHFQPQRAASSAFSSQFGDQYELSKDVINEPNAGKITSLPGDIAFGMYHFGGVPGEAISEIGYQGSALSAGGEIWLGIADYSTGTWTFFGPHTSPILGTAVFAPPDRYTSPSGDIYLVVVTFDGDSFTLESINVTFPDRQVIQGSVVDQNNVGIPGVLVSTPFANLSTLTDASGNFELQGLPDGEWPLVCTNEGWTFFSNPQLVTVAGVAVTGVTFHGHITNSNWANPPPEALSNNSDTTAETIDLSGPHASFLSRIDDTTDYFRFEVPAPGTYFLRFSPGSELLFPYMQVMAGTGNYIAGSYTAFSGTLCVPLTVVSAPAEFMAYVSLGGGGGGYSLSLESGAVERIYGEVQDPLFNPVSRVLVKAVDNSSGEPTTYMSAAFSSGEYVDNYRPAEPTTVSASAEHYAMAPGPTVYDLSTGPASAADFTATLTAPGDSFEPNDTQVGADANAVIGANYNSMTIPDNLSLSFGDQLDMYKVTAPAAGLGLRVTVTPGAAGELPGSVAIYEEDSTTYSQQQQFTGPGVLQTRLGNLTDGAVYYIRVANLADGQATDYTLQVETYPAIQFTAKSEFDTVPMPSQIYRLYVDNFGLVTDLFGGPVATDPVMMEQGETGNIEYFRYGFGNHRQTYHYTVGAVDFVQTFIADSATSADMNEPNNDLLTAPSIFFPSSFSATLSTVTDYNDNYKMTIGAENSLRIDIDSEFEKPIYCELYDGLGTYIVGRNVDPLGDPVLFETTGPGTYILGVFAPSGAEIVYTLDLSAVDGYKLEGTATFGGVGVPSCVIYCEELDRFVYADSITGSFSFGYVEPGTYTLVCKAPQFSTDQANQVVVITNADGTGTFTLTAAPVDVGEPDNIQPMANPAVTDGSTSAVRSVGMADPADYYSVVATAGQRVEIYIEWEHYWLPNPFLQVTDSVANSMLFIAPFNQSSATATFTAPANDTYFFIVSNGPVEYTYRVIIQ